MKLNVCMIFLILVASVAAMEWTNENGNNGMESESAFIEYSSEELPASNLLNIQRTSIDPLADFSPIVSLIPKLQRLKRQQSEGRKCHRQRLRHRHRHHHHPHHRHQYPHHGHTHTHTHPHTHTHSHAHHHGQITETTSQVPTEQTETNRHGQITETTAQVPTQQTEIYIESTTTPKTTTTTSTERYIEPDELIYDIDVRFGGKDIT